MEKHLLALNDPLRDKSWGAQIFCSKSDIAKKNTPLVCEQFNYSV